MKNTDRDTILLCYVLAGYFSVHRIIPAKVATNHYPKPVLSMATVVLDNTHSAVLTMLDDRYAVTKREQTDVDIVRKQNENQQTNKPRGTVDAIRTRSAASRDLDPVRVPLGLQYLGLFPDPRFLLFVPQNIDGYKHKIKCC